MNTHRATSLVLAAGLCVGVTGCGWIGPWGNVCTTIGYINEVRVLLTGDAASVTDVVLCDAAGECSVVESEWAEGQDAPLTVITPEQLGLDPTVPTVPTGSIESDRLWLEPTVPTEPMPSTGPTGLAEPTEPAAPAGPTPTEIPPYLARADGESEWAITVMAELPEEVTVTAYRADESIAGESSAVLVWERVGGSERCGGPMEAQPVIVAVS